jgi:phospholipid transport system substrate-binding protein
MNRLLSRIAVLLTASLLAFTATAAPTPPDEIVRNAQSSIQADITKNLTQYQNDKAAFYKMVDTRVVQYFDTTYIAQLILARNWKDATPEQRQRFESAFKSMLINSYADALLQYNDSVKAEVQPAKIAEGSDRATVNTTLIRKDAPPVPVAFDMRLRNDAWKVYDIKVENISLITNFRSQVAAQIKQSSLEAVIEKLESGQKIEAEASAS